MIIIPDGSFESIRDDFTVYAGSTNVGACVYVQDNEDRCFYEGVIKEVVMYSYDRNQNDEEVCCEKLHGSYDYDTEFVFNGYCRIVGIDVDKDNPIPLSKVEIGEVIIA